MRYRSLDKNRDYSFGAGGANFLVNSPAAVAQAVLTRLLLFEGEWFIDVSEGTPWGQKILGKSSKPIYDRALRERILGTEGVTGLPVYQSVLTGRSLAVQGTIDTQFGTTQFTAAMVTPR